MLIIYRIPLNPLLTELSAIWIFAPISCKKVYKMGHAVQEAA